MTDPIKITFITPCFCRGADCSERGEPEIRPASIRGQLHWWFRALGGNSTDENAIFGNIHKDTGTASKLVVRVRMTSQSTQDSPTLPHKSGDRAAFKKAFAPGTSFDLLLSWRLGGVDGKLREQFDCALDAWLHMGALGLRATRGGGNFTWEGQPDTPERYAERVRSLTKAPLILAEMLNGKIFGNAESARKIITDTLAEDVFGDVRRPLGGIKSRKTSPLRFRVVQFGDSDFRILAVWDGRNTVTGNTEEHLHAAIQKLVDGNKEIGELLQKSALSR